MENKIKDTRFWLLFWLIKAIFNYLVLCYDLEKDKDLYTYYWLFMVVFSLCMFIIHGVKLEILKNSYDKRNQ